MGTRARINVYEGDKILVSIYRQERWGSMDGYPSGLGEELKAFLSGLKLVNGLSCDDARVANGMGCLAAQVVAHLKDGAGSIYIRDTGPESHGEQYVYNLYDVDGRVWITVFEDEWEEEAMVPVYNGFIDEFVVREAA